MQPERPLLTIAIPTYNRSGCLAELLEILAPQLEGESRVELLISDNASPDDTAAIITEFQGRRMKMRYLRNLMNIGSDANFMQCFEQASGKYVWLIGDDDAVVPGGISKILPLLAADDYALVYMSTYPFRNDYLAERRFDKLGRFAQRIPNGLPFIQKMGTVIAFITAMIVNKDRYKAANGPPLHDLVGSNLMHLGWLLPVLGSGGTSLIVWEQLVAARSGNSGGWGICRVFSESLLRVLEVALPDNVEISEEIVNCTLQRWFPNIIMQIRSGIAGPLEMENVRSLLEPRHRGNWRYWLYIFPIVSLPYWAAYCWYIVTGQLSRAGRALALIFSYGRWHKDLILGSK